MNVLHISRAETDGGSARSAHKIHTGLREMGYTSRMLVEMKNTDSTDTDYIHGGRLPLRVLDRIGREVFDRAGLQYLFYPSSFALLDHPWVQSADVIQLYNTHGGYFTHRVLPRLSQNRIVVWRLSDMWPLTGHCAYSEDCDRWQTGCGRCPLLKTYPSLSWDTTALLWQTKDRIYRESRLIIVATNTWMEGIVRKSPLLSRFPLYVIPNGIDIQVFHPIDQSVARQALNLPPDAKIVLWAAHVARPHTRKGGQYVIPVLEQAAAQGINNLILLVAGQGAESWPDGQGYETIRLGYTQSDRLLATIYSTADVLIYPAVAENLPNSILESMACGTPVVAFDTGGITDAVRHLETGYIASRTHVEALSEGVRMLLTDDLLRRSMQQRCYEIIKMRYNTTMQTQRFVDLYLEVIAEHAR